jgi:hypothetical protein
LKVGSPEFKPYYCQKKKKKKDWKKSVKIPGGKGCVQR